MLAQLAPLLNKTAFETSLPDLQDCYYTHVCHNQSLPFNVPSQLWQVRGGATEKDFQNRPTRGGAGVRVVWR